MKRPIVPPGSSEDLGTALEELQALCDQPEEEGKSILHTAVSFDSLFRLEILDLILSKYPELTHQRDMNGFTPLGYAVQSDSQVDVVQALLEANPASVHLQCKGRSVLCWHIQHVSRQAQTTLPSAKTVDILIQYCEVPHLERALETLYCCNTLSIVEQLVREEGLYRRKVLTFGRQTRPSKIDFWVWEWASRLIGGIYQKKSPPEIIRDDEFPELTIDHEPTDNKVSNASIPRRASSVRGTTSILHMASQISDIPLPFLVLAMMADPNQIRLPDDKLNLPLHYVAMWQSKHRKSMSLTTLVAEYPKAVHKVNKEGKNPFELEQASGAIIE